MRKEREGVKERNKNKLSSKSVSTATKTTIQTESDFKKQQNYHEIM